MAEKKEETKVESKKVDVAAFKARKLKALNEMANKAKARDLAERILANK